MINNESEIFGNAPSSVIDAADVAGSSILAAVLAGKMCIILLTSCIRTYHTNNLVLKCVDILLYETKNKQQQTLLL